MDSRGAIASRSVDLSRTLLGPLREATRALRARLDPLAFPDVALLNRFVGVPTPHARYRFARGLDAPVYFLDFNYRDRARAAACLDELARVRRAHGLRFADKTLLLSARGLDPHGAALLNLAHEFAHHHVFFELWNNTVEIDDLHRARLQALYFVPVTAALDLGPAAAMPARPNRRVFVSLGTDDDLELVRAVIRARPDVHFCVPSVSWQKPSEGRRDFEVRIQAPNVTRVRCRPSRFSLHYLRAYASCNTVLVATSAAKVQQMRGGIRIADAIAAGKRLVATRSPMCELLMAQHERTCLVTGHDAGGVSTALDRMLDGSFQVDAPLFEAIRALTRDRDKLSWMMATRTDPARARRSPFWRDEADLMAILGPSGAPSTPLGALFGLTRGQRLAVPGLGALRVDDLRRQGETDYHLTLSCAGARPLDLFLSTAPTERYFRRTSRGHYLSYRGSDVTAEEEQALGEVLQHL